MRHPTQIEDAYGTAALAVLKRLDAATLAAQDLQAATDHVFTAHPAATVLLSFPGLGPLTGARVLAEIGDNPDRFDDARALKAYAGAAPVTRASGKSHLVITVGSGTTASPPPATTGPSPRSPALLTPASITSER